jgi:hypothetical protein
VYQGCIHVITATHAHLGCCVNEGDKGERDYIVRYRDDVEMMQQLYKKRRRVPVKMKIWPTERPKDEDNDDGCHTVCITFDCSTAYCIGNGLRRQPIEVATWCHWQEDREPCSHCNPSNAVNLFTEFLYLACAIVNVLACCS